MTTLKRPSWRFVIAASTQSRSLVGVLKVFEPEHE
jgi:hypothetical protein